MFGKTQSDLSKQKNREKQLGKKQSEETRLKRSIAMTGKEINKTIYTLTHPTHGTVSGTKQFFKNTYGLASSAVSKVLSGVYKSTRGWSL
jgi:Tfp pilus assembly protein PilV